VEKTIRKVASFQEAKDEEYRYGKAFLLRNESQQLGS